MGRGVMVSGTTVADGVGGFVGVLVAEGKTVGVDEGDRGVGVSVSPGVERTSTAVWGAAQANSSRAKKISASFFMVVFPYIIFQIYLKPGFHSSTL